MSQHIDRPHVIDLFFQGLVSRGYYSGGLFLLAALLPGPSSAQVAINELLASPHGSQEEFVELINVGEVPVPVAEIAFRDDRTDWVSIAQDSPTLLDPGELLVLAAADQSTWPNVEFVQPERWPSLNNSGDSLVVRIGYAVTDRMGYGPNERGRSMERIDPAVPGHVTGNWAPSTDDSGGTPGRINSRYLPDITPPRLLAAELDAPSSLILWLSEPIDPQSLSDLRIVVDGGSTGIGNVMPEGVRLLVSLDGTVSPASITAAGVSDYAGHAMPDVTVSVARPVSQGDVHLTELLVEAGSGPGDLPEFVEMTPVAGHPVSLRDATLMIGTGPEPDVVHLSPPDSTRILDPEETLLLYGSTTSRVAARHVRSLIESSLVSDPLHVELVPADASDLALRNTGDHVRLLSRGGSVIDSVLYSPNMRDPRFRNHRGRSIRRASDGRSNDLMWVSTLEERGTTPGGRDPSIVPGSAPEPGDLVFSELMPRPLADPTDRRSDQPEYVEIANISNRRISVNGLRLSGPVMDDGSVDAERISFQPLSLEPGDVAVFYDLPDAVGDSVTEQFLWLSDAFPEAYPDGVEYGQQEASLGRGTILSGRRGLLIPLRGSISLNDAGDTLRLLGPDGAVIDSLGYTAAMHHPAVSDPTGRALERTVLSRSPLQLGRWSTSTAAGGGSPGLLPHRPGPPPSSPDSGSRVRLAPRTISPDGDGADDRTVVLAENLKPGTLIRADIYDIDGRLVRRLVPGTITGDTFSIEWSGLDGTYRPVARGFYIVLIRLADANSGQERAFKLPVAVVR